MDTYTMRSRAHELYHKYTLPILPNWSLNAVQMQKEMGRPGPQAKGN